MCKYCLISVSYTHLHIIGMIGVDGALYRSMEFMGEGLKSLSMDDRLCIANMAIEAGAKNGIFMVDEITEEYMGERVEGEWKVYEPDEDAQYAEVYDIDLSSLRPTVSFPHLPENTKTIDEEMCIRDSRTADRYCLLRQLQDIRDRWMRLCSLR